MASSLDGKPHPIAELKARVESAVNAYPFSKHMINVRTGVFQLARQVGR